jgi:hypothetical protein
LERGRGPVKDVWRLERWLSGPDFLWLGLVTVLFALEAIEVVIAGGVVVALRVF